MQYILRSTFLRCYDYFWHRIKSKNYQNTTPLCANMDLEVPRPGVFAKTDSIHGIDMNPRHRKPKQKKHPRPHDSHGGSRTPVSSASLFLAYQASRCSKSRKKLRKGSIHPSPQPQSQSSCHQLPFASILPNMAFRMRVFSCIRWTVTKHSGTLVN